MAKLSQLRLRPRPGRTAASAPAPSPPVEFPASEQASCASVGLPTVSQTPHQEGSCPESDQHQEESCSGSEIELDSPPRLTFILPEDQEPSSPTSPGWGPPPSIDMESAMLPTFGSDTEEYHSSDDEDDPYFNYLVDNFIIAAKDVCKSSVDNIYKNTGKRPQSDRYAESALKYYNNDKNNKLKYDLISAITSCAIIDVRGFFGHVNFMAKGNDQNSKEELFFAELHLGRDTYVPTCVLPLEGMKTVGGLRDSKYDKFNGTGFPVDAQHCYACGSKLKHPKNGALYWAGHVALSDYYHG